MRISKNGLVVNLFIHLAVWLVQNYWLVFIKNSRGTYFVEVIVMATRSILWYSFLYTGHQIRLSIEMSNAIWIAASHILSTSLSMHSEQVICWSVPGHAFFKLAAVVHIRSSLSVSILAIPQLLWPLRPLQVQYNLEYAGQRSHVRLGALLASLFPR